MWETTQLTTKKGIRPLPWIQPKSTMPQVAWAQLTTTLENLQDIHSFEISVHLYRTGTAKAVYVLGIAPIRVYLLDSQMGLVQHVWGTMRSAITHKLHFSLLTSADTGERPC
eukprot:scaffold597_cov176-Amphora_coffeaeformis.AAC.11